MHIETKRVRTKGADGEQVINASDFNPAIHEEVTEMSAPEKKPARKTVHGAKKPQARSQARSSSSRRRAA